MTVTRLPFIALIKQNPYYRIESCAKLCRESIARPYCRRETNCKLHINIICSICNFSLKSSILSSNQERHAELRILLEGVTTLQVGLRARRIRVKFSLGSIGWCNLSNMVQRHLVQGYDNFLKYTKDLKVTENPIFILYTGTKLPDTSKSWCPDCVEAEPILEQALESDSSREIQLVIVEVGDRAFWKDQNCPFRTNPITRLKVLPTLTLWGTQKRLEGNQLLQSDLIDMLLREDGGD